MINSNASPAKKKKKLEDFTLAPLFRKWEVGSSHNQEENRHWGKGLDLECSLHVCTKLLQSCPTFCNPMVYNLPGSSVHEISQARILERVVMSSSRRPSWPRDGTWVSYISCIGRWVLYHSCHLGSPGTFLSPLKDLLYPLAATPHSRSPAMWKSLSHVQLFVMPWSILSVEFSRPEYWSR